MDRIFNQHLSKMIFILLLCTFSIFSSYAQKRGFNTANLDSLAISLISSGRSSGITVLLIKDGKPFYNKAFGYADIDKKYPLRNDHIFRIASQTKGITSLAALMLLEEGKFLLDEPISKYLPDFNHMKVLENFNAADSSYTTRPAAIKITIRDLFRHTSGISYPIFTGDERVNAIYKKAGVATGIGSKGILSEKIKLLASLPLFEEPGTAFRYGLNDDILGYLIELWSGKPLDQFFSARIFKPLGMNDTYFRLPEEKRGRLVALGVKDSQGSYHNQRLPIYEGNAVDYPLQDSIYLSGGAGLVSTTADYARFLNLFLENGKIGDKRIIGAKTLELMKSNQLSSDIKRPLGLQFGLGVALITPENKYLQIPSLGTAYWGGIYNTHYWVDSREKLLGLVYTQEYDAYSEDIGHLFKNVVYSSLDDLNK